jgi:hypothetical protein
MTRILIEFALAVLSLGAGVAFSQKIKDLITGVPAELRAQLDRAEAATVAKLKATSTVGRPPKV